MDYQCFRCQRLFLVLLGSWLWGVGPVLSNATVLRGLLALKLDSGVLLEMVSGP